MTRNEIMGKTASVCRDVFEEDDLIIREDMSPNDIEAWDSLTQLSLINEIEKLFNFHFTLNEAKQITTIGSLLNIIEKHVNVPEV